LVGGDVAVRDLAGGVYLSEGREAGKRSSKEKGAFGQITF